MSVTIDPAVLEALPEDKRREAEALLGRLQGVYTSNPLHRYIPHPQQDHFHRSTKRVKAFFGGNRCHAGWTEVRMADGSAKAIRDIEPGEFVVGSDEYGNCRPVEVLARFDNGVREVFAWDFGKRLAGETIYATADHRILSRHEKWDANRCVELGDIGKTRTRARHSAQRGLGYDLDPKEGEEYALLLGLLLGDGHVGHSIQFTSADDDITGLMRSAIESFGGYLRQSSANEIQFYAQGFPARHDGNVCVKSEFKQVLDERFGLCRKAHEKTIPDECFSWSNNALARLAAGLILTDGSVYPAPEGWRVGFTSCSRALAEGLHRILAERFGVYGSTVRESPRPDKHRSEYGFTVGNYWSLRRLHESIPLVGKKEQKLRAAISEWSGKRSDGARLRFRRKESLGMHRTYDLMVDHPDHLYVLANGIVTHNSGKTTAGIVDDLIQAVDRNSLPEHLKPYKKWEPPFKCRIVSPDFTATMEGVIFEKIREWVPRNQLKGGSWEKAYDKQLRKLRFENGSWFDFLTSEQDIDKFSGAALHRVHFDEEPPGEKGRQIYNECRMRLIDHGGDMVFSMTPLFGMSWVYDVVWEKRGPELFPGVHETEALTCVTVDMDDNPHLGEDEKEYALEGMTDAEKRARKSGHFVHFAGLVYDDFNPDAHVANPVGPSFLKDKTIFVGIDPGIKTTAVLFAAFDGDNDMLVFDEITLTEAAAIPEEAAKAIKAKEKALKIKPSYYIIDPAAKIRSLVNREQVQSAYARAGINTIAGQNAVEPGIFEVKRRLEHTSKKRPGSVQITRNCKNLLWEFTRYRMDPKAEGFAVVKENDHHLDVLRYLAMARPLAPHSLPKPKNRRTRWQYGFAPDAGYEDNYEPLHPFGAEY